MRSRRLRQRGGVRPAAERLSLATRGTNDSDETREEIRAMMTAAWATLEREWQEEKRTCRNEDRNEGQKQALSEAIVDMCELLGIAVSAEQRAQLAAMDLDRLVALKNQIKRTHTWSN